MGCRICPAACADYLPQCIYQTQGNAAIQQCKNKNKSQQCLLHVFIILGSP